MRRVGPGGRRVLGGRLGLCVGPRRREAVGGLGVRGREAVGGRGLRCRGRAGRRRGGRDPGAVRRGVLRGRAAGPRRYDGAVGRGGPLHRRGGGPGAGAAVGRGAVLVGLVQRGPGRTGARNFLAAVLLRPNGGVGGQSRSSVRNRGRVQSRCRCRCRCLGSVRGQGRSRGRVRGRRQSRSRVRGCRLAVLGRRSVRRGRPAVRLRAVGTPRRGAAPPLRLRPGGLPVVHALPATGLCTPHRGVPHRNSTRFANPRAGSGQGRGESGLARSLAGAPGAGPEATEEGTAFGAAPLPSAAASSGVPDIVGRISGDTDTFSTGSVKG